MVTVVNSKADVLKATAALSVNCSAARSLQEIMKSNLGPRGTLKMLVGGAGQIKITKDGRALLDEMQIQHPTACRIFSGRTVIQFVGGFFSEGRSLRKKPFWRCEIKGFYHRSR